MKVTLSELLSSQSSTKNEFQHTSGYKYERERIYSSNSVRLVILSFLLRHQHLERACELQDVGSGLDDQSRVGSQLRRHARLGFGAGAEETPGQARRSSEPWMHMHAPRWHEGRRRDEEVHHVAIHRLPTEFDVERLFLRRPRLHQRGFIKISRMTCD